MNVNTGEFRALTERVDDLEREVKHLRDTAFTMRLIGELVDQQRQVRDGTRAADSGRRRSRPDYLRAIRGGAS